MKKTVQIILGIVIVVMAYILIDQIVAPLQFQKQVKTREAAVIDKIINIRSAERMYKMVNQKYTGSFDTLLNFVLNDSITVKKTLGSADDSIAVAKGLVKEERFKVAVKDTAFGKKKLTVEQIKDLPVIPHADGAKFILAAGIFQTESKVSVPVFVCKAPYKLFLSDLNNQLLINLIDEKKALDKYPGIKVGSLEQATNDAGNWE